MRIPSVTKPQWEIILRKNGDVMKSETRYSAYAAKHLAGVWRDNHDDSFTIELKPPQEVVCQNGTSSSTPETSGISAQ